MFRYLLCSAFFMGNLVGNMFHHRVEQSVWIQEDVSPFDELILSWSGERPKEGEYQFYVSVKMDEWSDPLLYALWGSDEQSTFSGKSESFPLKVYQDAVSVLDGNKGGGFKIFIEAKGGAKIENIRSLHVYTNGNICAEEESSMTSIDLPLLGLSQMALNHEKSESLCSPSSTAAVVRYLLSRGYVDPVEFARRSWDHGFKIFGNWILNTAEAANCLGADWSCWVQKMDGFAGIYQQLQKKLPVVVSVRGPLVGSATPYGSGHLLVVKGYDAEKREVLCMDPAFATDQQTDVTYPLKDFLVAWKRRGQMAYVFQD